MGIRGAVGSLLVEFLVRSALFWSILSVDSIGILQSPKQCSCFRFCLLLMGSYCSHQSSVHAPFSSLHSTPLRKPIKVNLTWLLAALAATTAQRGCYEPHLPNKMPEGSEAPAAGPANQQRRAAGSPAEGGTSQPAGLSGSLLVLVCPHVCMFSLQVAGMVAGLCFGDDGGEEDL